MLLVVLPGCPRRIGDGCRTSTDCAFAGDRLCDLTQLEGYCTIPECVPNSCPEQALCIEFEAHTPRLARRFCMSGCEADSDCRTGYRCLQPTVTGTTACPGAVDPMSGAPAPSCTRRLDTDMTGRRSGYCVQME